MLSTETIRGRTFRILEAAKNQFSTQIHEAFGNFRYFPMEVQLINGMPILFLVSTL